MRGLNTVGSKLDYRQNLYNKILKLQQQLELTQRRGGVATTTIQLGVSIMLSTAHVQHERHNTILEYGMCALFRTASATALSALQCIVSSAVAL